MRKDNITSKLEGIVTFYLTKPNIRKINKNAAPACVEMWAPAH